MSDHLQQAQIFGNPDSVPITFRATRRSLRDGSQQSNGPRQQRNRKVSARVQGRSPWTRAAPGCPAVRRVPSRTGDLALAAARQILALPAQDTAAALVAELASYVLQLRRSIKDTDKAIEAAMSTHPQAAVMRSLPGMGPLVAAEFTVAVGGDLSTFLSADHLAAYAGLAPVPRDSGKRVGSLHRPQRYNRRLRHVFYMSALTMLKTDGPNRTYHQRKRAEGRKHQQALIALARRRVDVLWALLRDNRPFQVEPPSLPLAA